MLLSPAGSAATLNGDRLDLRARCLCRSGNHSRRVIVSARVSARRYKPNRQGVHDRSDVRKTGTAQCVFFSYEVGSELLSGLRTRRQVCTKYAPAVIGLTEEHIRKLRDLCKQAEQLRLYADELCTRVTEQLRFSWAVHPPGTAHAISHRDRRRTPRQPSN